MKKLFKEDDWMFKYVPDWFATAEMLEKCQDEELEAYKDRKAQKAKTERTAFCLWHGSQIVSLTGVLMKTQKKVLERLWGL